MCYAREAERGWIMNWKKTIGAGLLAGLLFYVLSLVVWVRFKFLVVVPLAVALPKEGLLAGWQVQHLVVSLVVGVLWAVGYGIYGTRRTGGWLYGLMVFLLGTAPALVTYAVINPQARLLILYNAVISLIGALLGGRIIALVAKP